MNVLSLILSLLVFAISIALPFSVHAGLLSFFFDNARADQGDVATRPSGDDGVFLRAPLHSDPQMARGGGDILTEDGVLVPSFDGDQQNDDRAHKSNGEISVYTVREGDTLSEIAHMYDVSAKTILWANNIASASKIQPGDTLVILPITGVRHVVKQGDTLASIAKKYSGDIEDILAYNQLSDATDLETGDTIIIPDGTVATPPKTNSKSTGVASGNGSSGFVHPVPGAVRTQGIHGYNGVDLAAPVGTAVRAAQGGQVIVARGSGWNGGYGLYIVIKHPNGTQTLYAHLSALSVAVGDTVVSGQTIGAVGNTGRSTGSHLHFEVRGAKNPF